MTAAGTAQLAAFALALVALAVPLGAYMARVYAREPRPLERRLYRALGVAPEQEMTWRRYATALLVFNLVGVVAVYALQRLQHVLPGNPNDLAAVDPRVAFNTAISFATNTDWQAFGGETTMSHLVQAAGFGVQNFLSAATGMAVLVALARGFTRTRASTIGNFWVDLTRSTLYILVPLSIVLGIALVATGVPQTLHGTDHATLVESGRDQAIAVGPVASQIAIKQLGTNGGGFYNANAAHPLENPSPLSNFLECLAILLVPAALCFTFGRLVGARRQGLALFAVMALLAAPFTALAIHEEAAAEHGAGNLEGKEVRTGVPASALWAAATTAASNGSVNAMHDSFTPLGGLSALALMALGEVAFGGAGSGLYGLLIFAVVAVFLAGLMIGRTPEFLGKKLEAFEMKMAAFAILVPVAASLLGTAAACLAGETFATALQEHGPHGFTEVLYAFTSQANNNGSAFAGLTASGTFYATAGGICMWVARYWVILPTLAIAGSLARKKSIPASIGTLPTAGPLFVLLLAGTVLLVGALSFLPALALGPIAEHLGS